MDTQFTILGLIGQCSRGLLQGSCEDLCWQCNKPSVSDRPIFQMRFEGVRVVEAVKQTDAQPPEKPYRMDADQEAQARKLAQEARTLMAGRLFTSYPDPAVVTNYSWNRR